MIEDLGLARVDVAQDAADGRAQLPKVLVLFSRGFALLSKAQQDTAIIRVRGRAGYHMSM